MRRDLKIRVCLKMQEVAVFLHHAGEIHFPGLSSIRQVNSLRASKAEIVEQVIILDQLIMSNPANNLDKVRAALKNKMVALKINLKKLQYFERWRGQFNRLS